MSGEAAADGPAAVITAAERRGLRGWPGVALAAAGGAAAAVAHPPFGVWPGIFGFALILHALDAVPARRPLRSAFMRGWAAGFAYLLIGTWWIGEAFFVDPERVWQAPFGVLLPSLGIGLFWGGAGLLYRLLAPAHAGRILVFAAALSIFEWLRGHVLTGFPWDLPGEAWRAGSAPSQAASVLGAYGLSFVTVAIGAAPAVLAGRTPRWRQVGVLGAAAATLLLVWAGGVIRLAHAHAPATHLRVRVVQPNLEELSSFTPRDLDSRFARYLRLSVLPSARPPDIVIWPEGALPYYPFDYYLAPGSWTRTALVRALLPGEALIAGGIRVDGPASDPLYYNSLLVLRREGENLATLASYDKYRLVPFGEFLPFPYILKPLGLKKLVSVGDGFSPGPRPAPISPSGLPRVQPLICYESLFPGFTSDRGGRPAWIVNISNDSWFGRTTGPWQHLNLASYRAIEEGLPMIRATPTGVSAVIDAYGRPLSYLGLGRQGVIDSDLPAALEPTAYARWGDLLFWVLCLAGLAAASWRGPLMDGQKGLRRIKSSTPDEIE